MFYFNSRPSARGDQFPLQQVHDAHLISIHAPPRGATGGNDSWGGNEIFQFTPLREGRRARRRKTPANNHNFNSRPSARGDRSAGRRPLLDLNFNSRPSARGDTLTNTMRCGRRISIHAPPRGATRYSFVLSLPSAFQFTPLREGRQRVDCHKNRFQRFQFTPLREGRLGFGAFELIRRNISIHAPPRGATLSLSFVSSICLLFQFTPLREGRRQRR